MVTSDDTTILVDAGLNGKLTTRRITEAGLDINDIQAILITRGPGGMSLLGHDQPYAHIPAANLSEVFDVTGAGDTVIAVATLALAAGLDLLSAGHLANYAAGLVVRKLGNATATPDELAWAIENW